MSAADQQISLYHEALNTVYVKQRDKNATASTEKQIEKTRSVRGIDSIKTTRPLLQKSPQR